MGTYSVNVISFFPFLFFFWICFCLLVLFIRKKQKTKRWLVFKKMQKEKKIQIFLYTLCKLTPLAYHKRATYIKHKNRKKVRWSKRYNRVLFFIGTFFQYEVWLQYVCVCVCSVYERVRFALAYKCVYM